MWRVATLVTSIFALWGHSLDKKRITVLIGTAGERVARLEQTISLYISSDYTTLINRVLLVWHSEREPCEAISRLDRHHKKVHLHIPNADSVISFVHTMRVLHLDDSIVALAPAVDALLLFCGALLRRSLDR